MYVTAFVDNTFSFSSTHSVEPMRLDSSAPQLQNLIERLGRQPLKEEKFSFVMIVMVVMVIVMVVMVIVTGKWCGVICDDDDGDDDD